MDEKNIKAEVKFAKQFYPKYDENINEGDFAIISWEVIDVIEGTPQIHPIFNTITTKGDMCDFSRFDTYTIIAKESPGDYGMQYDLIYIGQPADLSTMKNQRAFLDRILTEKQVKELFNTLDNPIEHIKSHDIKSLCKVKGIKEKTAINIIQKYEDSKDLSQVYVELDGYGLSNKLIQKLVDRYGSPDLVVSKVKNNPYVLADEVDGIGFKRADEIALENGLEWNSIDRIKGFIKYSLEDKATNGNSYIFADELMYTLYDELGDVGNDNIATSMSQLIENNIVGLIEGKKGQHKKVYLTRYYNLEKRVATELTRILNGKNTFEFGDWEPKIKSIEEKQGWKHTKEQYEGIGLALKSQVCVITGKGGTGKTSVVTAMLEALEAKSGKYSFAQTALSGRASAKLQEVTGAKGQTIHRLLGYDPMIGGFTFNANNKLPYDLIILDEISLVGGQIFLSLIQAIKTGSKLVILGDEGQLESIGCMNLAKDLIESDIIPTAELTTIHRQAKKSGIITEASKIRNHEQLCDKNFKGSSIRGQLKDFELNIVSELDDTRPTMIKYFKEWYPKVNNIMDIHLLVPIKERGDCSVALLNNDVQSIYNPSTKTKKEKIVSLNKKQGKGYTIREKDKVMVMKNNYKTQNTNGEDVPIFNGWIGIVEEIDDTWNNSVTVSFPIIQENVIIPFSELKNLSLGYASTIHKYQGSSSKVIIGGVDYSTPPFMRTKELMYTLVTRAEKYCVLVAQEPALREAIGTSGVSKKNTFLQDFLKLK